MRVTDERLQAIREAIRLAKPNVISTEEVDAIVVDLQEARAELTEAIEVIKGMVFRADDMNKSADEHPEREMTFYRAVGGDRVAHSGREYLERIGVDV
ncbi:hypothetical protein ACOALA_03995 [Alicyclobacillus acidoterrestris]|uniref:hypothetical protein n=1 Tax=Alicyclobacillus acidoterrestris TaxID=1450 RepID=UPI003F535BC8